MSVPNAALPDPALVVLIGPAGSGKSTLARTWPATQVLELDYYRALVSDEPGDQAATADAVRALRTVLEARLARKLTCVVDATNTEAHVRKQLLAAARRHDMPAVAVLASTPLPVCLGRNTARPESRRVPEEVVRAQHAAVIASRPRLAEEGFDHVVLADDLHRLKALLRRASDTRCADLGLDGGDGLGDLLLVRRFFGSEILPLWRWKPDSQLADGDRVAEIRLGPDRLVLALRTDVDGEGDYGFDALVRCPMAHDCPGPAWAPVHHVTDLYRALTGAMNDDPDIVCTVHGGFDDADQETDDHGLEEGADFAAPALEVVGG
ncbi:ATP-binding protein [Streptomyces megasporus]|uniref:ATP-binding protein n=1 Tax=Streptomyces megasporus TaxID=44060 RepID=UPI00055A779F|nr:ATP-binding protein [Streptomyces megasporus]